jgi:hypothetical protein
VSQNRLTFDFTHVDLTGDNFKCVPSQIFVNSIDYILLVVRKYAKHRLNLGLSPLIWLCDTTIDLKCKVRMFGHEWGAIIAGIREKTKERKKSRAQLSRIDCCRKVAGKIEKCLRKAVNDRFRTWKGMLS